MKGRKPIPESLKITRNTDKARPQAPVKEPPCPDSLVGDARAEWKRVAALLVDANLVAELDCAALALYCQAWADWREAQAEIADGGKVIMSPKGYPIINPWVSIARGAAETMRRLLAELGLSPSARTRLVTRKEKPPKQASKWAHLIPGTQQDAS
jgi:P27 family predicted phage terminase small subunit